MKRSPTSSPAVGALAMLVVGYVLVALVAGAPDSPLAPPSPRGASRPDWTIGAAAWLRLDRLDRRGLTVVSILLLAGLVGAFVVLLRETWRGRVRLAPILVAGAASLLVSVSAPLLLSRDVYSYAAYGRIFALHNANPYLEPPSAFPADPFARVVSPAWFDTRSLYGPAFTLVSAGIARAWPRSPQATILAFKLLSATALAVATVLTVLACRRRLAPRAPFAAAVLALNPVLVVHTVGGGHNDTVVAALLAAALLLTVANVGGENGTGETTSAARRRWTLGVTAFVTLAALVKIVAVLPLALWVWSCVKRAGREAAVRQAGMHAAVVLVVAALISGPFYAGWRTPSSLLTLASVEGWASGFRLLARGAEELGRILAGSAGATPLRAAVSAAFVGAFGLVLWRLLARAAPESSGDGWGTGLLVFALAAPYLLPWYVAWFAPFLAFLSDPKLTWIGVAAASLLALTGVPAEPGSSPELWRGMVLGVHYLAAPLMLGLFVLAAARVLREAGQVRETVGEGRRGVDPLSTMAKPMSPADDRRR